MGGTSQDLIHDHSETPPGSNGCDLDVLSRSQWHQKQFKMKIVVFLGKFVSNWVEHLYV